MISVERTCDLETCTKLPIDPTCDLTTCRAIAIAFLGISTLLNLALIYLESKSLSIKNFPALSDVNHSIWWVSTFNLLSLVVLFDQSITGLHNSIFKLTVNETRLCPLGTHISGGLILFASIVIWLIMSCMQCVEYYPKKEDQRTGDQPTFIFTVTLIFFFYVIYIFTDTPWPWDCLYGDPNMKKIAMMVRLILLGILVHMALMFGIIYIVNICRVRRGESTIQRNN
jgi:hypothetical protein